MVEEFDLVDMTMLMGCWFLVTYFVWLWKISSTVNQILDEIRGLKNQIIQVYETNDD